MNGTSGFDLQPPPADTAEDRAAWDRLLARVKQHFVFWPNERVKPKENHIAIKLNGNTTLKLPRDGTKFRSLATNIDGYAQGDVMTIINVVGTYATFEFGTRVRHFTSLIHANGTTFEESDRKSSNSEEKVAACLEGVSSPVDVDWTIYGGDPDAGMWDELAANAIHGRDIDTPTEEKVVLLGKEFFARRMQAKAKVWPVIKTLRLCHAYGHASSSSLCKLPQELLDLIEEWLMLFRGAPRSRGDFLEFYDPDDGLFWMPRDTLDET